MSREFEAPTCQSCGSKTGENLNQYDITRNRWVSWSALRLYGKSWLRYPINTGVVTFGGIGVLLALQGVLMGLISPAPLNANTSGATRAGHAVSTTLIRPVTYSTVAGATAIQASFNGQPLTQEGLQRLQNPAAVNATEVVWPGQE